MKKYLTAVLSIILLVSMLAQGVSVCAASAEGTFQDSVSSIPTHKTGQFRDMDVPAFLSQIGPGYSVPNLMDFDPTIGYDPYISIPVMFYLELGVIDSDLYMDWRYQMRAGETNAVEFDLKDLPETPVGVKYNACNVFCAATAWQDINITVRVENARIELPGGVINLPNANGNFERASQYDGGADNILFFGLNEESINLPETAILQNGTFKADVTLINSDGPDKTNYYYRLNRWLPTPTSEWFEFLKSEGFNSMRFQVTWFNHTNDDTYEIDKAWLDKVEEVVNLALEQDLYCTINVQFDMFPIFANGAGSPENSMEHGWLTLDGDPKVEERFAAVWKQISERFKDYDEFVIFESVNEPVARDDAYESLGVVPDPDRGANGFYTTLGKAGENLNRLNQIFVDTVRATGGNNAKRFLYVPPYFHKGDEDKLREFSLPSDPANHTIVCLNRYQGDEEVGSGVFPEIEKYLIQKGIGVVFTEFAAMVNLYPLDESVAFVKENALKAKADNIPIYYYSGEWGSLDDPNDPNFSLYNPYTFEPVFPEIIDSLIVE